MDDFSRGRAVSLYYYNLAYSIPLYLHIDLKTDNENALVFWWYRQHVPASWAWAASGRAAVWEAQKKAMQTY